jgi:hypothetical protein
MCLPLTSVRIVDISLPLGCTRVGRKTVKIGFCSGWDLRLLTTSGLIERTRIFTECVVRRFVDRRQLGFTIRARVGVRGRQNEVFVPGLQAFKGLDLKIFIEKYFVQKSHKIKREILGHGGFSNCM